MLLREVELYAHHLLAVSHIPRNVIYWLSHKASSSSLREIRTLRIDNDMHFADATAPD